MATQSKILTMRIRVTGNDKDKLHKRLMKTLLELCTEIEKESTLGGIKNIPGENIEVDATFKIETV